MNSLKMIAGAISVAVLLTASLAYAAPSCCDPGNAGKPVGGSILPGPQFDGSPVAASPQPGRVAPAVSRPIMPAAAQRPAGTTAEFRYPMNTQLPQPKAGQAPSCCPVAQPEPAAAPGCCPGQQIVAPPAGCCPIPGSGYGYQAGRVPGGRQFSAPACGAGGCGAGGTVAGNYWPQTVQPISNFTGGQVRPDVRAVPASSTPPRQYQGTASNQGFGQPGYFGSVSPVNWSLY